MADQARSASRFHVQNIRHAKTVAKAIKNRLDQGGYPIKLSGAQTLVADIYGHRDWHSLEQSVGDTLAGGPYDNDLTPSQRAERFRHSIDAFNRAGVPAELSRIVLEAVAPTGGDGCGPGILEWKRTQSGQLECREDFPFDLRIRPGMLDETAESSISLLLKGGPGYEPVLTTHGFSAFPILENGDARGWPSYSADTEEGVVRAVTAAWQSRHKSERELKAMRRAPVEPTADDIEGYDGLNEIVSVTEGIRLVTTTYGYFLDVSKAWVDKLPEPLRRPGLADGESCAYSMENDAAVIVLSFPRYFTPTERSGAASRLEKQYPATARYLRLGDRATASDAFNASRGFSRDRFRYVVKGVLPEEDGSRTALAAVTMIMAHASDTDPKDLMDEIHRFKIAPGVDLGLPYRLFDPDEHEYLGVAGITQSEWGDQLAAGNTISEDATKRQR